MLQEQVISEVKAIVAPERESDLMAGFHRLGESEIPDGLIRSELLRGPDGLWRIQTLWRDKAALEAVRRAPGTPAAPALFRQVGAIPELTVFTMAARLTAQE